MSTWYRIRLYLAEPAPEAIEVVKDTGAFVVLKSGRREAKDAAGSTIRTTSRECWQWLIDQRQAGVSTARAALVHAEAKLKTVQRAAAQAEPFYFSCPDSKP